MPDTSTARSKQMTLIQVNETKYLQNSYEGKGMKKIQLWLCLASYRFSSVPRFWRIRISSNQNSLGVQFQLWKGSLVLSLQIQMKAYPGRQCVLHGTHYIILLQWQNNVFTSSYRQRSCQPSCVQTIFTSSEGFNIELVQEELKAAK